LGRRILGPLVSSGRSSRRTITVVPSWSNPRGALHRSRQLARLGLIDRGVSDLGAEETGPEVGVRTQIPHPATLRAAVPPQVRPVDRWAWLVHPHPWYGFSEPLQILYRVRSRRRRVRRRTSEDIG